MIRVFIAVLASFVVAQPIPAAAADAAKALRVAFQIAETSFDPAFASDAASDSVMANIFDRVIFEKPTSTSRFSPTVQPDQANARQPARRPFQFDDFAEKPKIPAGTLYAPYQRAYRLPLDGYWDRPVVLNEYGNLWLQRDGTPTVSTRAFYDAVLGPGASADARRRLHARYLAADTEFWRAARTAFGVQYAFGLANPSRAALRAITSSMWLP